MEAQTVLSEPHELMRYFSYNHLDGDMRDVSEEFHELAEKLDEWLKDGSWKDMALEHLLIAKDVAVRAALNGLKEQ